MAKTQTDLARETIGNLMMEIIRLQSQWEETKEELEKLKLQLASKQKEKSDGSK